jgi:hypothetical protein
MILMSPQVVAAHPKHDNRVQDGLRAWYQQQLQSDDPLARRVAAAQLASLERVTNPRPVAEPVGHGAELVARIESVVGPLRERPNNVLNGPCAWHASKSGTCLVVWPTEGRWWCSSCRRSGDLVTWVVLTEGISFSEARKQLGFPRPPRRRVVKQRPKLVVEVN